MIVLNVFGTLASLAVPFMVRPLVDVVYPNKDMRLFIYIVCGIVILELLLRVGTMVGDYLFMLTNNLIEFRLKLRCFSIINRHSFSLGLFQKPGMVFERLASDTVTLSSSLVQFIPQGIQIIFSIVGCISCIAYVDQKLAMLVLLILPAYYWLTLKISRFIGKVEAKLRNQADSLADIANDSLTAYIASLIFGIRKQLIHKYSHLLRDRLQVTRYKWKRINIFNFGIWTIRQGWISIIILIAWLLVFYDKKTPGNVVALSMYIAMLLKPFEMAGDFYRSMMRTCVSADRLTDILRLSQNKKKGNKQKSVFTEICDGVLVRNLTFAYPEHPPTINNVNFNLKPSEIINIMGPTGSGKTTLLFLLAKLYTGYDGQIMIDSKNLPSISDESYWNHIALVCQDNEFFSGSIYENCVCNRKDISLSKVRDCANMLDLDNVIMKLPNGYNTKLNNGSFSFSAGQKQKLAMIRALIREPWLLLLDEMTSNMDVESERKTLQTMIELRRPNSIVIMVSHRMWFNQDERINRTFTMDNGCIVELLGNPNATINI